MKLNQQSTVAQKKCVSITISGARALKARNHMQAVSNIAPFFFYQFYTEDDHYSHNAVGENPTFNDTQTYEVLLDSKAIKYFEQNKLDVILFDDHADIGGVSLDQQSQENNDDMIGMASIPLDSIATGCSMHNHFDILSIGSNLKVGTLDVRIDVMATT